MVAACFNTNSQQKRPLHHLATVMSFLSVEPQSRVLLENYSNNLLAQIDTQLDIIADRYLAFFQERRTIEATYIDSLRKLHRKAIAVDASFDPRVGPTTTRAAWDKVRDNLDKGMNLHILNCGLGSIAAAEANTQQAFVDILDDDVIKPLRILKESKYETRNRIEEDLKRSAAKYADFAENTISKLQQSYLDKYNPRFRGRWEDLREPEPDKSEEGLDSACRYSVALLNDFRAWWAADLGNGYDCLEGLVFTPTVKDVLVRYMDEVESALAGTDTSGLRGSFRRTLSFSIPPLTLYRNYHPGAYSDSHLIFGVPLVDLETDEDNVSKVMKMCIEEVEKRGLNTHNIYVGNPYEKAEVRQLRHRLESEKSFSFSSTDNVHSVAMLLLRYIWDLPEPLFMLSMEDYRNYRQNRASYTENNSSRLRSKIRELHPVLRASLRALLRHLRRVASHSDKNGMPVEALAGLFRYAVLRANEDSQDGVHVKHLVLEDVIHNAHTLFDECPPPPPVPSPHVADTTSTFTSGSFLSPEPPRSC
ncbi:Rho GTPase activation protein [Lactarius psammicola]|nr:Rho GTPase activation protein [Lactarius psammicola]